MFFSGLLALFENLPGRSAVGYSEWISLMPAQERERFSNQLRRTAFTIALESQEWGISSEWVLGEEGGFEWLARGTMNDAS